jgi:hypothetical protein
VIFDLFVFHCCKTSALGLGMSAINSAGNSMREYGQEREIERERVELNDSRVKQAELEGRLRALEATPRN